MSTFDTRSRSSAFLEAIERAATFAFQPIVNIHTGHCFGFEALIRNVDKLGFNSIPDFFDYAWNAGILHRVDMVLRQVAISQFARSDACRGAKLFYNIDGRIFESQDYHPHQTGKILSRYGLPPENLVLELSEKYDNASARHLSDTLRTCREHNYQLAIDDFGRGFSEMQMLYEHQPDYIKIDRFFINGIADDSKKRLFVSSIVNLAHVLGITVLAEGVETEREFLACKGIGCDLVQGFYVARPTTEHDSLSTLYEIVPETNSRDRRQRDTDKFLIRDFIEPLVALSIKDPMSEVFEAFRIHKNQSVFPILGEDGRPLGLVREGDLKDFIYLQYGRDLLQNKAFGKTLKDFLSRCPITDINTEAEKILETYAIGNHNDGILITENFQYVGFLTADALLRIINEKNLKQARDQNPLSKLPGNNSVVDYIAAGLEERAGAWSVVYFDFNDFKPFNDTYGFRQGDRAITVFADLLRDETRTVPGTFLGHIGGDDFFAGFKDLDEEAVVQLIERILVRFKHDVESFYSTDHREAGAIEARDRHGQWRRYALLSCCAAIIHLAEDVTDVTSDTMIDTIAKAKKGAKMSDSQIEVHRIASSTTNILRLANS